MIFTNPWYLLGLLLSATPIIIHLWFRRKLKKIPFSSLDFLKKTEAHRFGWLKLRDILILILRCLIIVFLFSSLARPVISGRFFFTERLASLVIIMDNSFSMGYSENFSRARETAVKLIDRYSPRSEFLLLPLCEPEKNTALFWQTRSRAKEQIQDLAITYNKGDVKSFLKKNKIPNSRYDLEYIYIGDCQESNFIGFEDIIAKGTIFYAIKVSAGSNTAITNIELSDPISVPEEYYDLKVSVKNYAAEKWNGKINIKAGVYRDEDEIRIAAHSEQMFEYSLPAQASKGVISIYDDSLITDNIRYFSKKIPYKLKLLIINSNSYLKAGLQNKDINKTPFIADFAPVLSGHDLRKYDVIILNGIAEINAGEKLRLKNFLADSTKGLICFLSERTGENLRELIAPCSIDTYLVPQGYVTLDWIDIQHRILNVFKTSNALRSAKFYRFQKLNRKGKIIAQLSNNYPLITQINNIIVIATELDPRNTDIIYKTSFVPLLFRLIAGACRQYNDREFMVGDKSINVLTAPTGLIMPKGNIFLVPGFYLDRGDSIAVNIDPAESDLKPLGTEQAKVLNIKLIDHNTYFGGTELSNLFLILALTALLLEVGLLLIK